MGNVYYRNKDYSNAEEIYYEALDNFRLFDSIYDDEKYYGIITSLQNLALIFQNNTWNKIKLIYLKM